MAAKIHRVSRVLGEMGNDAIPRTMILGESVKKHNGRIDLEDAEQSRQLLARLESQAWSGDALADEDSIARLMYAITALPSAEQRLIFDFYFDGRSHQELARELDISSKAIESRLYRLRGRLRAILENTERTYES